MRQLSKREESWRAVKQFAGILIVILVAGVGIGFWQRLDAWGYVYHDEMTTVYSPDWQPGEYKVCTTLNGNATYNILCDGGVPSGRVEDGKIFVVRFWGRIYDEDMPHVGGGPNVAPSILWWNCTKNQSGDPSITCHQTSDKQPHS